MAEKQATKQTSGDCPNCGKDRWANILGEQDTRWYVDEAGIGGRETHRLLECAGCKTAYYQHISTSSEDVAYDTGEPIPTTTYFPHLSKRERPGWLARMQWNADHDLVELFSSLYTALDHDLTVLAASGVRTVFDLATTKLGIDPALTFQEKIEELKAQGRIGQYEQEDLTTMINAASAAMHGGWKPPPEELDAMMTALERFIQHSFMLKDKADKLKAKVPRRPRRRA
jgi:uncharacterized protein DUF4145